MNINVLVIGGASLVVIVGFVLFVLLKKPGGSGRHHSAKGLASSLSNEKMKSEIILNSIEDGVVLLDEQQIIQLFNPAAGVLTGWDPKEAMGLNYKGVLQLTDDKGVPYPESDDPFQKAITSKSIVRDRSANLQTRSKTMLSLDMTVSPLLDGDGNVMGAVGIFRNVSEQRKEEAQRADFISTASHEMRTPVAAIEGYLALALNDKVSNIDSKAKGFLEKAHESTQHLGKLFQDLLTSAKAEDGRLTNNPKVVEMSQLLDSLTDSLKFSAEKKGLSVEFVLGAEGSIVDASDTSVVKPLYYVHADPDRLREVITNLFDNAVKYTESGKVTLGLTGDNTVIQTRISDTGPGIPSEDLPHLFQKFYRVDNSATRTIGGTGLGLFICRKIVELYQGRIWVDSEVGKGSTFYINLPRLTNDQAAELQRKEATQLPSIGTLANLTP
jgi:PAS domain S-box-containing protein